MCTDEVKTKIQRWAELSPPPSDIIFLRDNLRFFIKEEYQDFGEFFRDFVGEDESHFPISGRDALDRFVRNKNPRDDNKDFLGSSKTWIPVACFLIDADYLTLSEILKGRYDQLKFITRLNYFYNNNQLKPLDIFCGKFSFKITHKHYAFQHNLVMRQEGSLPYLNVKEICFLSNTIRKEESAYGFFQGYAIATSSDSLLIMLTNSIDNCKKTYLSLTPIALDVLQFGFAYQLVVPDNKLKDEALQKELVASNESTNKNISLQRVADFSGNQILNEGNMKTDDKKGKRSDLKSSPFTKNLKFVKTAKHNQVEKKDNSDLMIINYDRSKLSNEEWELSFDLELAVNAGNLDEVKRLVSLGADVNYPGTNSGMTTFHVAAKKNDWALLEYLLGTGKCDLLQRDDQGWLTSSFATLDSSSEEAFTWRDKLQLLGERTR